MGHWYRKNSQQAYLLCCSYKNDSISVAEWGKESGELSAAVWHSRLSFRAPDSAIIPDDQQLKYAKVEFNRHWINLVDSLSIDSFFVNPIEGRIKGNNKTLQLLTAKRIGIKIPRTSMSNNPFEINNFLKSEKDIIYKSFMPHRFQKNGKKTYLYTATISKEHLNSNDHVKQVPGIYQQKISKSHELRVVMMGNSLFTVQIESQKTEKGKDD